MKKAVSFFICLVLILSMTSVFASDIEAESVDSTADEVTYCYGTCGENLAWEFAGNGTLTISGSGETDDYRFSFSPPWNGYNVKKLIVCDGVTRLGTYAFSNLSNLTEVSLPDSVKEIGEGAFLNCKSLNRVNIESVGGWCEIAFKNYTSNPLVYAKKLYIGDSLITIAVIPNGVESINDYAFCNCVDLESIALSDSVTEIGNNSFYGCEKLADCKLGNSLKKIGNNAFYGCQALTNVKFPESLESIGINAFIDCRSITELTIPNSMTEIDNAVFSGCSSLEAVYFPDTLTKIGTSAFEGCKSLLGVVIPNGVSEISNSAFYNCSSLESVVIPDSVTSISYYAFYGCQSLKSVALPESVSSIGKQAFLYCDGMERIVIKNPDCVIFISADTLPSCAAIYSAENSTAQTYAETFDKSFGLISDCEEHVWSNGCVTKKETCVEDGIITYVCTLCGEVKTEAIPKTGVHSYLEAITKEPSETEEGIKTFTCEYCGDSYTEAIPKLASPDEPVLFGDVNLDGTVNVKDATYIQRIVVEEAGLTVTAEQKKLADIDGDGVISVKDATALQIRIVNS